MLLVLKQKLKKRNKKKKHEKKILIGGYFLEKFKQENRFLDSFLLNFEPKKFIPMGKHVTKKIHAPNGILFVDFEFVKQWLKVNEF